MSEVATTPPVLRVDGLSVSYRSERGMLRALRNVDLVVPRHRIVGIVGESGCGKSTLIGAILALLAQNAVVEAGSIMFEQRDILRLPANELQALRGQRIAAVFQDPMTSLNPVISIATQMIDIQYRDPAPRREKRRRAIDMLCQVGLSDPSHRIDEYPHRLSGGMRQRVAIAMALLMRPALLIADEPTTALDVSMEAQIATLFQTLRQSFAGSILFVSHNLGLIAELCDEVVVMYAGEVMERCDVFTLFRDPRHPYTRLLLDCDPARMDQQEALPTIPGTLPDLAALPEGCVFAPRCPRAEDDCREGGPVPMVGIAAGHVARCRHV